MLELHAKKCAPERLRLSETKREPRKNVITQLITA